MKLSFILLIAIFMTVSILATPAGYFMPTDTIRDPSDYLAYEENDVNNSEQGHGTLREFDPDDIPYLIITTSFLQNTFIPLKNWKTRKGVRTEIVTTELISTDDDLNGGFQEPYMQIKNCIKYYLDHFNTQYVLLGGDYNAIPQVACWSKYLPDRPDNYSRWSGEGCYSYDSTSHTCNEPMHHNAQTIPADIFYSCIDADNLAWNHDNDSKIGEPHDGPDGNHIDLSPVVYVGRIPVAQNGTELEWLTNWVNKIIAYENPAIENSDYSQKLLHCGGRFEYQHSSDSYNDTPHSDVAHWSEDMYIQFISPNAESIQRDYLFDCYNTNLSGFTDPGFNVPQYRMGNVLNRNYNLIFEASHANAASWQILNSETGNVIWTESYTSYDVDALENDVQLGVIYSWGCTSAAWDIDVGSLYSPNRVGIAKEFLVKPTGGGAVGYIGYTRWGIGTNESSNSGIGFDYAGNFYAELLNHDHNDSEYPPKLGMAFAKAKANFKNNSNTLGLYRWGQFGLNLVGDPELNVYTACPTLYTDVAEFTAPSSFVLGQTHNFNLNTGDIRSKACLYNDNGVYLVEEADPSTGVITFSFTPANSTPVMLTITGYNRVPFLATIPVRQGSIVGIIALSESPSLITSVNVDLIDDITNSIVQSIHPNSDGTYQFEVPFGLYKIKYSLINTSILFYSYTTNLLTMNNSTPQLLITLPLVTLYALNLNDIRVSNTGYGSFTTINAALDFISEYVGSGLNTGEPIRIRVLQGTYPESVDLSPLAALGITNFALEGAGDVTINGDVYGIKLVVEAGSPCNGAVYNIKDIKVTGSEIGILFKDFLGEASGNVQAPQLTLHVQGCTVYDCSMGAYPDTSLPEYSAAGIHFEGAGSIENCNLYNNQATGSSVTPPEYGQAGGLFVKNNSSTVTEVLHNTFSSNQGGLSGGLVAKGTGQIRISNMNTFTGNTISTGSSINAIHAHAMSVYDASDVTIKNNLFIDNLPAIASGTVVGLLTYVSQAASPIIFANNTISNTPLLPSTGFSAIKFKIIAGLTVQDIQIRNNIISVTDGYECSINSWAGYSPVNFDYNMLHNTTLSGFSANLYDPTDPTSVYNPSAPKFNYQCDPQLDSNYAPIWDQYTMSPCIDNAHPDTDGDGIPWNGDGVNFKNDPDDIDSDGTCLDIGSIPAAQHDYEDYAMPVSGNIKWLSFPVLNRITGGYTINSNFFDPIIDNLILDWVEWKPEAGQKIIMQNTPDGLQNGTQSVTSPVGYKVKLKNEVTNQIKLETPGFIQAPATTINLYKFQSGTTTINENWIGYFQRTSSHPFNAFAPILNYLTSIRAQYWSMARMPKTGVWIMTPGVPVINYGDMVIVTVSQDCSFTWNNSAPVDPKVRDKAVEFEFTEKPDYTALYLDLASLTEIPSEIGVYIDGTCKGAVKVESSFTDICVYLEENEALSAENCELVLYYAPKSAPDYRKTCKPGADDISRVAESGLNFYTMKLTSDSELNPVIPITDLRQNYPNPFNPTTTIDYELAETGSVRIEIYNVKGQNVTTLVDCAKTSGPHRVIWNGTDKYGRAVSSGIYHYRLISKDKSITKKMLLLK